MTGGKVQSKQKSNIKKIKLNKFASAAELKSEIRKKLKDQKKSDFEVSDLSSDGSYISIKFVK